MPEITINAMSHHLGPSLPTSHRAWLAEQSWPNGGRSPVLMMQLGDCTLKICPAIASEVRSLAEQLLELANCLDNPAAAQQLCGPE